MEEEVVIIKHYTSPMQAYIDAGWLRDNDIECAVDGVNNMYSIPAVVDTVTLSVRKQDEARALELLN